MRKPLEKIFKKDIEGVGVFVFQHLTLREELQVENMVAKLLDFNNDPASGANVMSRMIATLTMAIVQAPEKWKLEDLYDFEELGKVFDAYIEEVQFFRGKGDRGGEKTGPGEGQEPPVLVPSAVPLAGK